VLAARERFNPSRVLRSLDVGPPIGDAGLSRLLQRGIDFARVARFEEMTAPP
jgi:hypothetical protein